MHREPLGMQQGRLPRWSSAVLLLAVFFLPLHFHAATASASQLTHECSCLHGTRTEMGLTAVAAPSVSLLPIALAELFQPELVSQSACNFQSIRAPRYSCLSFISQFLLISKRADPTGKFRSSEVLTNPNPTFI